MSFLFGKKSKAQPSALPAASREISSSHGQPQQAPVLNGAPIRDAEKTSSQGSASVNNSLNSLQNPGNAPTPEPKALRERADSSAQVRPAVSMYAYFLNMLTLATERQRRRQSFRLAISLVVPSAQLHRR